MFFISSNKKIFNTKGFTLVELIVSLALFTVVTLVAIGALLSIVGVNRKTQSAKSVINNLNLAVESISKSMRVGSSYHCEQVVGTFVPLDLDTPEDCPSGGNLIAFEGASGDRTDSTDQIVYRLNGTQVEKSINGGASFLGVTAPEVDVTEGVGLRFYVLGTSNSDGLQPRVIITLRGLVDFGNNASTDFNLQTSVSQREADE
jgi:prepilin-type N-terminal cleavage/methylation domain-containing protein